MEGREREGGGIIMEEKCVIRASATEVYRKTL